jgi:glycosyltransferase involved in cell wall biosynthesis
MKKTILYIIDSLNGIGGAEVMLVSPLEELHKIYNIVIVTLKPGNAFENMGFVCDEQYCLHMHSRKDIFSAAAKLKKIISENNVDLVHSFLYWSVIVARLACGKKITHIFSLATIMSEHIYKDKWYSRYTQFIDKITYKKNQIVISPTKEVLDDFKKHVGIKGRQKILYNFVSDNFFKSQINYKYPSRKLKLVAVGNLKKVKNYQLLIDAFKSNHNKNVSLDIYGDGILKNSLQDQITKYELPIRLMGAHEKIYNILHLYDAFVMPSLHEGFGISAAEAMAVGLPLILSDINTLQEITHKNALFFNPAQPESFQRIINSILEGNVNMEELSEKGKKIAMDNYTRKKYMSGLLELYNDVSDNSIK